MEAPFLHCFYGFYRAGRHLHIYTNGDHFVLEVSVDPVYHSSSVKMLPFGKFFLKPHGPLKLSIHNRGTCFKDRNEFYDLHISICGAFRPRAPAFCGDGFVVGSLPTRIAASLSVARATPRGPYETGSGYQSSEQNAHFGL